MKLFNPNRFLVRNFSLICSLLIVLFFSVGKGWGQTAAQYSFTQSSGTYTALVSPTVLGSGASLDNVCYSIASTSLAGFTFNFAGTNYTSFTVSPNGFIGLGSSIMSGTMYSPLSATGGGNVFVSAYGDDLGGLNTATQISWKLEGTSPNRQLVVEYRNIRNYNCTNVDLSFQIRLVESTNTINVVYGTMTYASTTSDAVQVGIKSSSTSTHFSNRSTSSNWTTTTSGSSNSATCTVLNTVTMPTSGLTFTWSPPAPCAAPADQPTSLSFSSISSSSISGSFSAAASSPSGYLVVRSTSSTPPSPVDGTTYAAAATTLGSGTYVVQSSSATSFTSSSLSGNSTYYYHIFSYNNSGCSGGPKYLTVSPLSLSSTTCASSPSATAASNIATTSFTANWSASTGGAPLNYLLYVATDNSFTNIVSGFNGLDVGTATNYSVTGLSAATTYYYRIIAVANSCNSTNSSTITITTLCTPELAPTQLQDFSTFTGSAPQPSCWTEASSSSVTTATTLTITNSEWLNSSGFANTGSNTGVKTNLYSTDSDDWLISNEINLGNTPGVYRLRYDMAVTSYNGTTVQSTLGTHIVRVIISTDAGATWSSANTLLTYTGTGTYSNTGQTEYINLTSYSGVVKIAFVATTASTSPDIDFHLDNFKIEPIPTCFNPTGVTASSITTQGASLNWAAPSSGTTPSNYDYEIRTSGAAGSGATGLISSATVSTNSASISGLSPATSYSVYVRSSCGNGEFSAWTSALVFTSACDAPNNPGTISVSNSSSTGFTLTYAAASPVPTSYVLFNTTGTSTAATTIPSLTNGTTYASSTAYIIGGTSYNCITASSASPQSLTGGGSNTQYNYFLFSRNATNSCSGAPYFSSGVMVSAVTCAAAPTSPSTAGVTTNGATISWTASDAGGGYGTINYSLEVYTDAGYSTPISGSPFSMGTTVTQNLSGLTASTTYYYRIVASNGVCNSAYLTGSFITLCLPITSLPWTEGFEGLSTVGTNSFPICWLEGTGTNWNSLNTAASSYNDPRTGSKYVGCYYSAASNARLWTPGFQLTAGVSYDFSTYFVGDGFSGWTAEIVYNTSTLATGETTLGAQFITGSSTSTSGTTYTQIKRTFIPSTTGEYYFGVKVSATSAPWGYLGFDDFTLELTPTCFVPTALVASSITSNGATLGWTAPSTGTSPSNYNYEVRTSGAAGSGSTGLVTSATVSSNSASISGLIPSTTYSTYVRSSCGNGDYSVWSTAYSFTTACAPISVFPSTENFTTYLPNSCWVEATNGNQSSGPNNIPASSAWTADGYLNNGSTGAVKINIDASSDNEWIITPFYSLPMSDYRVKFDVGATEWNNTYAPTTAWETDDFVQLLVNVNGSASWTILKTYNNTNVPSYLGQTDMFSLSSYAGQTVRFAFRAKEGNQDGSADIDFFIDNFTVEATPISTWTGTTNTNWATASNWSNSTLPVETNVIIIPSNVPNFPDASSITIGSSGLLSLQSGAQLTISGTLTNNGTLTLESGATLVQGSSSTLAGSGTYNVKQAITGDGTTTPSGRFWYLGSPVSLASSSVYFASNAANVVKKRSESTNAWTALSSGTPENLVVGQGYYTQAIPANSTINFTGGLLNNGAISITNLTRTAGQGFEGFNLVSNPYPSYLNWDVVSRTNVDGTMWYRTHDGTNMVFETYVAGAAGGVGTNLSGNTATKYIPPMQSYWVRVTQGQTSGSLALDNNMRSHFASLGSSTAGLRSTQDDPSLFLRMNLLQANKKDQLIVYVNEQATNGFDILDGEKMMQAGYPQFYTKAGDKKIVINGLNSAKKQQALPVTIELPTTGIHSFVIEDLEISNGLVWLEDKQEEIIQALEPGTVYEFYANAGLNAERFVLHFQLIDDAVPTNVYNEVNSSANFSGKGASVYAESAGVVVIKLPASAEGVTDIQIRDAAGKLVYSGSMNNLETSVQLAQANGIYYVTLSSSTGVEVRKVFIQQ